MAYHREERFSCGGKWYTQLYSQVIPVESRGNYVVLQNENFTTVKIVYCSSYYYYFFIISFHFILFLFKEDWQSFFPLKTNFITKNSLGRDDLLLREQAIFLLSE